MGAMHGDSAYSRHIGNSIPSNCARKLNHCCISIYVLLMTSCVSHMSKNYHKGLATPSQYFSANL